MPRESADSITASERKNEPGAGSESYQNDLAAKFEEMFAKRDLPIRPEAAALFEIFGHKHRLDQIHPKALAEIDNYRLIDIRNTLKWLKRKMDKGYKPRSFWAIFTWRIRKKGRLLPWKAMVAQDYLDAIEGKATEGARKVAQGVDTSAIPSQIRKLQKITGEVVTCKALQALLSKGSHRLRLALDWIIFRSQVKDMDKWIGLAIWAIKLSEGQIKFLYKSTKEQAAQAAQDKEKAESFEEGWANFDGGAA